jgi:hypothetical protein
MGKNDSKEKGNVSSKIGDSDLAMRLRAFQRWVIALLLTSEAVLAILHATVVWETERTFSRTVYSLFHVDREANLPTWFSSSQLALLGLSFLSIFLLELRLRPGRRKNLVWLACAGAMFFLSADEASTIHERLGTLFMRIIEAADENSLLHILVRFPSYYWAVIYAPFAIPLGILMGRFVCRELKDTCRFAIAGLVLFFIGSIGLDYLEGAYGLPKHKGIAITLFNRWWAFDIGLVEELMEMVGVTLVIAAVLPRALAVFSEFIEHEVRAGTPASAGPTRFTT